MGAVISAVTDFVLICNAVWSMPYVVMAGISVGFLAANAAKRSTGQFHPLAESDIPHACSEYTKYSAGTPSSIFGGSKEVAQKEVLSGLREVFAHADPAALPQGLFAVEHEGRMHIAYREPEGYAPIADKAAADAGWTLDVEKILGDLDAYNARYEDYCLSQVDEKRETRPVHELNVLLDEYTTYLNETIRSVPRGVMVPQDSMQVAKYGDLMAAYGAGTVGVAAAAPAMGMIA